LLHVLRYDFDDAGGDDKYSNGDEGVWSVCVVRVRGGDAAVVWMLVMATRHSSGFVVTAQHDVHRAPGDKAEAQ
jgi:hypothetical protein